VRATDAGDVALPGQVGARRRGDDGTKLVVFDAGDSVLEIPLQRCGRRDAAGSAALDGPRWRLDGADTEAKLAHRDAAATQACEERVAEEGELARPHARRGADREHAALQRDRARAIGDPRADRLDPDAERHGIAVKREAVLARALDDAVERLGCEHARATAGHAGDIAGRGADDPLPWPRERRDHRAEAGRRSVTSPSGATGSKAAPRRSERPTRIRPSASSRAYAARGRGVLVRSATM
jgi:hypothetical protein